MIALLNKYNSNEMSARNIIEIMLNELNIYILEKYPSFNFDSEYDFKDLCALQSNEISNTANIIDNIANIIQEYAREDILVYDPCYGSGNLIKNMVNRYNRIRGQNTYGTVINDDLFFDGYDTFANGEISHNIKNENCLYSFINNQFSIILSDPPIGIHKLNYDDFMMEFEKKNNDVAFRQVYPVKSRCFEVLIIQKCIHNLKNNGIFQIIIPNCILFANRYKKFRKWLVNVINIRSIILITTVSSVITMTRDGSTTNVQFISDLDSSRKNITIDDIISNDYGLW
jgi:type I restriction-modification system DNA methylase subunit